MVDGKEKAGESTEETEEDEVVVSIHRLGKRQIANLAVVICLCVSGDFIV